MTRTDGNGGWTICCTAAIAAMVLAFTPVFLPVGVSDPKLGGMPYALWAGIGFCVGMVVLTAVGTVVHPGGASGPDEKVKQK